MVVCRAYNVFSQLVGEPVRPCREMGVRSRVGGQVLPGCGPQAAGVGDSMHSIQGSRFLVLLVRFSLGGGVPLPIERMHSYNCWPSCRKRWGSSRTTVVAISMVTGRCRIFCAFFVGV